MCLLLRRCSTAAVVSVRVLLLRLAGLVCINYDIRLLALVVGLIPLAAAVVIVFVCDRVLQAGALSMTVGLACTCPLLRALLFLNI